MLAQAIVLETIVQKKYVPLIPKPNEELRITVIGTPGSSSYAEPCTIVK